MDLQKVLQKVKEFLASPEGAPAITALLRALITVAIGIGVVISDVQAEQAVTTAASLIVLANTLLSFVTIKAVKDRADDEEAEAALTGKVLKTNASDIIE
jgi:4-hydroxybenzoate polyprenyltransferase